MADLGSLDLEASVADLDLDSIAPLGGSLAAAGRALAASPRSSKMIAQLTSPPASRTRPGLMRNPGESEMQPKEIPESTTHHLRSLHIGRN